MEKPEKLKAVKNLRAWTDRVAMPKINPYYVSLAALAVMPGLFWLSDNLWLVLFIALISLFFDWADGVIATQHNLTSSNGYWIDSIADRLSELVIVLVFSSPWLELFLLNIFLMSYSWAVGTNLVMPLRWFLVLAVILKLAGLDIGLL